MESEETKELDIEAKVLPEIYNDPLEGIKSDTKSNASFSIKSIKASKNN